MINKVSANPDSYLLSMYKAKRKYSVNPKHYLDNSSDLNKPKNVNFTGIREKIINFFSRHKQIKNLSSNLTYITHDIEIKTWEIEKEAKVLEKQFKEIKSDNYSIWSQFRYQNVRFYDDGL